MTPLLTGLYALDDFRRVVDRIVARGAPVLLTLPREWARRGVPILSPEALRVIDLVTVPEKQFPAPSCFVLEVGRTRFNWKSAAITTMEEQDSRRTRRKSVPMIHSSTSRRSLFDDD
jgi:hypothetical protein